VSGMRREIESWQHFEEKRKNVAKIGNKLPES
jgi:hypothetical protein